LKLGNKILRQRLKGPALAQYYPPRISPIRELRRAYPAWDFEDENEEARLESIRMRKLRGKGAPKKRKAEGVYSRLD
jgi:small subunit ribosomal protein S33